MPSDEGDIRDKDGITGVGDATDGKKAGESGRGTDLGENSSGGCTVAGRWSLVPAFDGEGDKGWSITDVGVCAGDGVADCAGEVPADASPRANLARSLSSRVTRGLVDVSVGEPLVTGLAGRCVPNVLRKLPKLLRAVSANWVEDGKDWRSAVSMEPRPVCSSVDESRDGFGECCERVVSTALRHWENINMEEVE